MKLPAAVHAVAHYFFAYPVRMLGLAVAGIVCTLLFQLWARWPKTSTQRRALVVLSALIAGVPLLVLFLLMCGCSGFCFLGGPDGQIGSAPSVLFGSIFAAVAVVPAYLAFWNLRTALKTRSI